MVNPTLKSYQQMQIKDAMFIFDNEPGFGKTVTFTKQPVWDYQSGPRHDRIPSPVLLIDITTDKPVKIIDQDGFDVR